MELWHFEFLEIEPKTRKSAKNRRKLDLSNLVFVYLCHRPLVRCVPELIFPELRNRPRWGGETLAQNQRGPEVENNSHNLVQAISQPNLPGCTLGQEFNLNCFVLEGQKSTERHTEMSFL